MRQLNSNIGNGLLELPQEIEDDNNDELDHMAAVRNTTPNARRRSGSGGRRRSSFGGSFGSIKSPVKSAAEQSRIAEMYKTVIKMSSENVNYKEFLILNRYIYLLIYLNIIIIIIEN
jgi:hypothetical protein